MPDKPLGNVFFIGGTGMLADAARWIAPRATSLTLAARNPSPLAEEVRAKPHRLDWAKQAGAMLPPGGTFDIVISWLHDEAIWLARPAEDLLKPGGRSIRIHGANSLEPAKRRLRDPDPRPDIARQTVILGWVESGAGKRWLTHSEISQGVISAIRQPNKELLVVGNTRLAD